MNIPLPGRMVRNTGQNTETRPGDQPTRHHSIRREEDDLPCLEQVDWDATDESRPILLHGEIMNIHEEVEHNRWRIGVRIDTHDPHKAEITHYITHRQAEIMREIRHASEGMTHSKR